MTYALKLIGNEWFLAASGTPIQPSGTPAKIPSNSILGLLAMMFSLLGMVAYNHRRKRTSELAQYNQSY